MLVAVNKSWNRSGWLNSLNPAERQAVREIREKVELGASMLRYGVDGWWVRLTPSTGTPKEVVLIHKHMDGTRSEWKIEKDGSWNKIK